MPDAFISYSTEDEEIAQFMRKQLVAEGIDTFLASVSIPAGAEWSEEILKSLKGSDWVFFLASESACKSAFVQQELGGALVTGKTIVPIVWNIDPGNLPGWIGKYQAINLARSALDEAQEQISSIASKIRSKKLVGALVLGAMVAAAIYLARK